MRSTGDSKTRWSAMDSSTTPRLGPRCPPVLATACTRNSRISSDSSPSSASDSAFRSRGPRMFSRIVTLGPPLGPCLASAHSHCRFPRDGGGARCGPVLFHLLGDLHRLVDQRLHDLRLGYGLDDLALDEDLALAVAGGDAEVGLAGLARAVHHAAHDRDAQRDLHALQAGGDLVGELVDVDLGAAAGRAADDLQAT